MAYADTLSGRVVAISDGDTITVLDTSDKQHKIRLSGIDAPEKGQPFGDRSKQHLSDLLYDKAVAVAWKKYDRYGRIVGKVMVAPPNSCRPARPDCPTRRVGRMLVHHQSGSRQGSTADSRRQPADRGQGEGARRRC